MQRSYLQDDPRYYTSSVKESLNVLSVRIRQQLPLVDDEQAKTLLLTTAAVLEGLMSACEQYELRTGGVVHPCGRA